MARRMSLRRKGKIKKGLFFLVVILWLSLAGIILFLPPVQGWRIALFFGLSFLSLFFSLLLISSALNFSFIFCLGIMLSLFLKYLRLLTWVNGGLLLLFCLISFFALGKLKK